MTNILPCPYCGGDGDLFYKNDVPGRDYVICQKPDCAVCGPSGSDAEGAIDAWNAMPREQKWTKKNPEVPGWYASAGFDYEWVTTPIYIRKDMIDSGFCDLPNRFWLGPIILPELPENPMENCETPKKVEVTLTRGKRRLYRHSSGMGTVMEFNDGTPRKVVIADAAYRGVAQWGTYCVDMPGLTNYDTPNSQGKWLLYPNNTVRGIWAAPTLTDAEINSLWVNSIDEKTAKENCDLWVMKNGTIDEKGISGVPAVNLARSVLIGGVPCDVPNIQTLMRIFIDAEALDDLDPTVEKNPTKALTSTFSSDERKLGGYYAWSSTEYSSLSVRFMRSSGDGGCGLKYLTHVVLPVREL